MRARICCVALLVGAVAYAQAAAIEEKKVDTIVVKKATAPQGRSDEVAKDLNARDGRDNKDYEEYNGGNGGGSRASGNDLESDWKNDNVKGADDNSNSGGGGGGYKQGQNSDSDGGSKSESKIEISTSSNGGGGGDSGSSYSNENDNKNSNEYVSSGSNKNSAYEKNEHNNEYVSKKNEEKNTYEKKEEPKSAYGDQFVSSALAEVIAPSQSQTMTLDQIYRQQYYQSNEKNQYDLNTPYGQLQQQNRSKQQEILLLLKPGGKDYPLFDPRNNNTAIFIFKGSASGAPADNAAYVPHNGNEDQYGNYAPSNNQYQGGKNKNDSPYQSGGKNDSGKKKDKSYLVEYSLPFKQYYKNIDPNRIFAYDEGVAESIQNFTVGALQRLLFRFKSSCRCLNQERNPYPLSLVLSPLDDPRLCNCRVKITDIDGLGLQFGFEITNLGIWAVYARKPVINTATNAATVALPLAQTFIAKRRIGNRPRYDTLVDGAVEYDRRQGLINYYLNGYHVWSIYAIGVLSADDGVTSINRGQGVPQVVVPTSFKVDFGTGKCLDEVDPNNPNSKTRLVSVLGLNSTYYGLNDTFYDVKNLITNQLWGQGCIFTLLKLLVLRAESIIFPQQILPGIYGAEHMLNPYAS